MAYIHRPSRVRVGRSIPMMIRHGTAGVGGTTITGSGSNLTGSGAPEGVVAAAQGSWYGDTATGFLYFKFSGGSGNTGWNLVLQA